MKKLSLAEQEIIFRLLAVRGHDLEKYLKEGNDEIEKRYREEFELVNAARSKMYSEKLFKFMDRKK